MFTADLGIAKHQVSSEISFLKQKNRTFMKQDPVTRGIEVFVLFCFFLSIILRKDISLENSTHLRREKKKISADNIIFRI